MIYRTLILLLSLGLMVGCASKRFEKLAVKNEQAGLFEDAADLYLKSLKANKNNVDAKIGARKNGQTTLDRKLTSFTQSYQAGQVHEAVFHYLTAKTYADQFSAFGIALDFPAYMEEQFNEVKNLSIEEKYRQAVQLLDADKFAESETLLREILRLQNPYKDVAELFRTAHFEPLYRNGLKQMENKLYRKAYYTFAGIMNETGGYKEALQYRNDALASATYVVAVDRFDYRTDPKLAQRIRSNVISQLTSSDNPFLKVVDMSLDKTMSMQKKFDAHAVLSGRIIQAGVVQGKLVTTKTKGFQKHTQEITDPSTGVKTQKVTYSKITYDETSQENSANVIFSFQLVSLTGGEILLSDEHNQSNRDQMHYAVFQGDSKNVYPGYWKSTTDSKDDLVKTSSFEYNELQKLFEGKKSLKSPDQLMNELLDQVTLKTSGAVIRFNPED